MKRKITNRDFQITIDEICEKLKLKNSELNNDVLKAVENLIHVSRSLLSISYQYQLFLGNPVLNSQQNQLLDYYIDAAIHESSQQHETSCYIMFAICIDEKFDQYAIVNLKTDIEKQIWQAIASISIDNAMDLMKLELDYELKPMKSTSKNRQLVFHPIWNKKNEALILLESYDFRFFDSTTIYNISDYSILGLMPLINDYQEVAV